MEERARAGLVGSSRNILLRGLSPADQALLEPHAEPLLLACGGTLLAPDEPLDAVYFPGTALLSIERPGPGHATEVALVGREGLVGWPALLGATHAHHAAVGRIAPGTLLKVRLVPLRAACARSPTLLAALLRFVHVVMMQMAHALATAVDCPLDQRLARWLLMRHDRVGGDVLAVQHDEIAGSLGVRRASVTDRLHRLEGERLIRCNRGRIAVRDRSALQAFAGQAYGPTESQYSLLIAPFGKGGPAAAGGAAP